MVSGIGDGSGLDMEGIRGAFPVLSRKNSAGRQIVYFDNAATTQRPLPVIRAVEEFYSRYNANVHRGIHTLSEEATDAYENARETIAGFIRADSPNEMVFVRGTTEAINLVAYTYVLKRMQKGGRILTTLMEHHSNIVPWQMMRDMKGLHLDYAGVTDDGHLDMEDLASKIEQGRPELVAVTHMSNVLGTINDVKAITEMAHDAGAVCLVDGAQSVPHLPVDVKVLECDMLAFSGHKMCGPTGIGVLHAKREILESTEPFMSGGDMIREVHLTHARWNDIPYKFEAGTPNIAGAIGLGAACRYLEGLGMDEVRRHEKGLTQYALDALISLGFVEVYGPRSAEDKGGVISFNVKGVHSHDVASLLDAEGVAIRSGHHCAQPLMERLGQKAAARASFYIYNTREEVDVMIDALGKVHTLFSG